MIYFIRHGESQANLDQVFGGPDYPAPLTTKGRAQARAAGEQIKAQHLIIDHIVTSPLARAHDTATAIASVIGFDHARIQTDARLIEYDMGSLSGQPLAGVTPHERVSAPGAEDPATFQQRVMAALNEIKSKPGNTLIISHAGVGRMIKATQQNLNPRNFYELEGYPNAQLIAIG